MSVERPAIDDPRAPYKWHKIADERDELRTEVEGLRERLARGGVCEIHGVVLPEAGDRCGHCIMERDELRAEVGRLRVHCECHPDKGTCRFCRERFRGVERLQLRAKLTALAERLVASRREDTEYERVRSEAKRAVGVELLEALGES